MHLGPNAGRIPAGGDRAGGVDDASHPVVGGDELDDLLRQHERQRIQGHREHGDRVDLRHVRSDVPPERHRGAGVGGNELVDRDAETPLPAPLVLVVHDVAVDLAVAVVDVPVTMRMVERQLHRVPARVAAVDGAMNSGRDPGVALAQVVGVTGLGATNAFGFAGRQRRQRRGRDASHAELAADLPSEPAVEARRRRVQRADHETPAGARSPAPAGRGAPRPTPPRPSGRSDRRRTDPTA